jgi:hypothetical protein
MRAPSPCTRVMLLPVAVPATPHLVDAALRDVSAELGLVVHDADAREVVHLPACAVKPRLQVDLLRVEEEVLVEEPDLVERLSPQHDRGAGHPVDTVRHVSARLSHAEPAEGHEADGADERRREAPRRVLQTAVRIDEPRTERGHARMIVEICREGFEPPVSGGRVLVEDVDVPSGRRTDDGVVIRTEPRAA